MDAIPIPRVIPAKRWQVFDLLMYVGTFDTFSVLSLFCPNPRRLMLIAAMPDMMQIREAKDSDMFLLLYISKIHFLLILRIVVVWFELV